MNTFIENQNWRYATKKFDSTKKISDKDFETLLEAIRLTTSSYGLQPYKVLIVGNPELRKQIQPFAWGQTQITEASHLIIFANVLNIGDNEIDSYVENLMQIRDVSLENVKGYSDFMKMQITNLPNQEKNIWTSKQTYLAMGNLINAAAELKIDVTPMEGFEPENINKLLGLDKLGLNTSLIATVGYRHPEDLSQFYPKVRKTKQELFINL